MSFFLVWLNRSPAQLEDSVLSPVVGRPYGKAPVTIGTENNETQPKLKPHDWNM